MADTKSTPEIVTEKDLEPVLRSSTFDSATFLKLYAEWKVEKDPHTFATLRTMHENAGYNNKAIMPWSSEQEMHEIAAIVQKYQEGKIQISQTTALATARVVPTAPGTTAAGAPDTLASPGTTEVREALQEINPESLEKAVSIMESFINKVSDPQTKSTLRGVHGAIIFDILRGAGHNLTMQNGQIIIVPKPGTDVVNLQEKLQTLVNTGRLSQESLKIGMLYSSPAFKAYSELKKTKDATGKMMIDPKASPQDFMQYLKDLEKAGNTSADVQSILKSQRMLQGVNMQEAIRGFQDLGQIGKWAEKNEATLKKVQSAIASGGGVVGATEAPKSTAPLEPNTTLTGKIIKGGETGGKVTGFVGDGMKGLTNGIGDILSLGKGDPLATLGIGAVLAYGVYKAFQKFGFLGGMGTLFGLGALNNIEKIMARFGVDVGDVAGKVKKAGEEAVGAAEINKPDPSPANGPQETLSQKTASDKIRNSTEIKGLIDSATKPGKKRNADLEKYLKFINNDLKDKPALSFYSPSDNNRNIFADTNILDPSISLLPDFDPVIFKSIMRMYITGVYMSPIKMNEPTNVNIIKSTIGKVQKNATLSQAIEQIQK